ncbi:hypothetical protein GCM10009613_60980 [Pseudonocardia kongjuensis]|uniref:Uncharacterized protein n=1 Tax=Pseudonocardia kongjuensis TaxID=102227 RepID=A0ABN1Y9Y6_9PSEU
MTPPELLVQSEVLPSGTYGVAVAVGEDEAWTMAPDRAVSYAAGCVAAATEARHDAAVIAAFVSRDMLSSAEAAKFVVFELRPDRVRDDRTAPLRFVPGVSAFTGRPFVHVHLHDKSIGQLDPSALREHALGVLDVVAAADLDAALVRTLRGTVGVEEHQARAFVEDLSRHWPKDDTA